MSTRVAARRVVAPVPGPIFQTLFAVITGLFGALILLFGLLIGYNIVYAGRIYPGVSIAGIEVGGMPPGEASARLGQELAYPRMGRIGFQGERVWLTTPAEVGLYLDANTSALAAYNLGRQGSLVGRLRSQFQAWQRGIDLPPFLVYDARVAHRYVSQIAAEIDKPTVEAALKIEGTEVVVLPGQVGRQVDIATTLAPLEAQLRNLTDGILPIVLRDNPPVILDASAQAAIARQILSAPLTLRIPAAAEGDPGPWGFDPPALAKMMTIERVETAEGMQYQVGLQTEQLREFLNGLSAELAHQPENARFIFNDDTRLLEVIQPAVIGRTLNVDASIEAINQQLAEGKHEIDLVFDYTQPAVGDGASGAELGITELVHAETSYFYGSSNSRIQNIQTAAARFHGVLVPPGATFSMAEVLGDVSLDNGYAEALIIFGNRTIKGVGGGVCQVSTTLFRTVFFGGFPVVERHSHAYRVSYYELTRSGNVNPDLAGLDATVFVPVVDLKFTNDTPYWLLMETYVNVAGRSLTWKFYSTSDGRTVDWETTGIQNVVAPEEPLYQENPELGRGEIEQVDWEAAGADVSVFRTVVRDGQVYLEDTFSTHYLPWRAVYEYGPGTKIPKDKKNKND